MKANITLLPGDGIGPEVVAEGRKVLSAVAARWQHQFEFAEALIGGIAIDTAGSSLPEQSVAACRAADAVLLGAVGGPKWDDPNAADRPERGLLGIRKALGLYANLRPVQVLPSLAAASPLRADLLQGVDLLVVRELTGGIYFGEKRRWNEDGEERASDLCIYTTGEIERIARTAFELARGRRGKLSSVDKANVLETSRLWRRVVSRIGAEEYPDIQLEHMLVDAAAMHLMRRPADFDVLVTENMFGDILSDEASMLAGSMGMLPSASLGERRNQANQQTNKPTNQAEQRTKNKEQNQEPGSGDQPENLKPETWNLELGRQRETRNAKRETRNLEPETWNLKLGLYEPIHGSAPDIAARGIANPLATILSIALMLRLSLGLEAEAQAVEAAVRRVVDDGKVTPDIAPAGKQPCSTTEVGDAVVAALG